MQYFLDRQYLCACRGHDHSDRAGKSQHDGYWDSAADNFRFLLKIEYYREHIKKLGVSEMNVCSRYKFSFTPFHSNSLEQTV